MQNGQKVLVTVSNSLGCLDLTLGCPTRPLGRLASFLQTSEFAPYRTNSTVFDSNGQEMASFYSLYIELVSTDQQGVENNF
jgi:hypothetical protein